ncbi:L,D-transpeptidase family protein [Streptomyces pactum]|uniref:L,D-transpeptidase family protein n=1 Tax=Streptomyces pactum TaxID=68249 RepID=UPI0036FDC1BD
MPDRLALTRRATVAALLLCTGVLTGYGTSTAGGAGTATGTAYGTPEPSGAARAGDRPAPAAEADSPGGARPAAGPGPSSGDTGTGSAPGGPGQRAAEPRGAAPAGGFGAEHPGGTGHSGYSGPAAALAVPVGHPRLPGLGPETLAAVPRNARQAVVVTGEGPDSPHSAVVLYEHTATGWTAGPRWPAHNALRGWTDDHRLDDLRSPRGVFGLTDAGGLRPDPGAKLPYDHSGGFVATGLGFEGEPLTGAFDYVVAINYNREPGTSPLDWTRPLGEEKGGGIWIHVDHGGPTHGCVSIAERHMRELLRALDPERHPVVVMGDAEFLAR